MNEIKNSNQLKLKYMNEVKNAGTATVPEPETMTFGMQLVGISFNPSGDPNVNKAKQLCAQLADLVQTIRYPKATGEIKERSELENLLYTHTIGEILNAQMNVVKLLTLKY